MNLFSGTLVDDKSLGIKGWLAGPKSQKAPDEKAVKELILDKHRIAILPLSNISPDPKDEYFADGMTEELTSTLSTVPGLRVIARTSVMKYKGLNKRIREIGEELNVGSILEGSVRKADQKLRITIQLIDARSEEHLSVQNYDRELKDVFSMQSDIANLVADVLKVQLVSDEKRTVDPEAYSLYLKGRNHWYKSTRRVEDAKEAIAYFEQATKKDPSYPLPFAALSTIYSEHAFQGLLPSKEAVAKARTYALKAIEMDNTLAEAHTSLATVLHYEWNWAEAEAEVKKAIKANPSYVRAYWRYAHILLNQQRNNEAILLIRHALELDPISARINTEVGTVLYYSHRFDEAIPYFQRALEIDKDHAWAHGNLGMTLIQKGLCKEGVAMLQKSVSLTGHISPLTRADLACGYALCGQSREAREILRELEKSSNLEDVAAYLAALHAILGEKELAFEWLEKAYKEHSVLLTELKSEFWFENIRSDPRFTTLLKRVGLEVDTNTKPTT